MLFRSYVEETGAAQHLRDARITTIYEGTTGIQANDFVGRKILKDQGRAAAALVQEIAETESSLAAGEDALAVIRAALADGRECLVHGLRWLELHWDGETVFQSTRAPRHHPGPTRVTAHHLR